MKNTNKKVLARTSFAWNPILAALRVVSAQKAIQGWKKSKEKEKKKKARDPPLASTWEEKLTRRALVTTIFLDIRISPGAALSPSSSSDARKLVPSGDEGADRRGEDRRACSFPSEEDLTSRACSFCDALIFRNLRVRALWNRGGDREMCSVFLIALLLVASLARSPNITVSIGAKLKGLTNFFFFLALTTCFAKALVALTFMMAPFFLFLFTQTMAVTHSRRRTSLFILCPDRWSAAFTCLQSATGSLVWSLRSLSDPRGADAGLRDVPRVR